MVKELKKIFLLVFIIILLGHYCEAATTQISNKPSQQLKTTLPMVVPTTVPSPVQSQPIDFSACNKFFKIESQKLFYLTLAGINANRFEIVEIQSKSGYIIFSVAKRRFLASIVSLDPKNSLLKITPCNNTYFFPMGIIQNMFKYVELNINIPIEKLAIL